MIWLNFRTYPRRPRFHRAQQPGEKAAAALRLGNLLVAEEEAALGNQRSLRLKRKSRRGQRTMRRKRAIPMAMVRLRDE
jgi:hypothetical protein